MSKFSHSNTLLLPRHFFFLEILASIEQRWVESWLFPEFHPQP
ncbi:hypothetical protein OROMI_006449 [Orobanche minor]